MRRGACWGGRLAVLPMALLTSGHLDRLRRFGALHLDPARLRSLRHRDGQMQNTVGVARLHILGVEVLPELQLTGEPPLRPLRDEHVLPLLVLRPTLRPDRQHVSLGCNLHARWVHPRQVQRGMITVVSLPDVHCHSHRRPGAGQQLAGQPVQLAERIPEWIEPNDSHNILLELPLLFRTGRNVKARNE